MSGGKTYAHLQKSDIIELLEIFMTSSSAPLILLDSELKILFVNSSATLLLNNENFNSLSELVPTLNESPDFKNWIISNLAAPFSINTSVNSKDIGVSISKLPNDFLQAYLLDKTFCNQINRVRNDMEKIIRHDLKNPLNGILGFSQLLLEDSPLGDTEREWVQYIKESGNQMLEMLNHFLDIYKMEEGNYLPAMERFDLISLFEKMDKEVHKLKSDKLIDIIYILNDKPFSWKDELWIFGEEIHIESLFYNLIENAIEASPEEETMQIQVAEDQESIKIHIRNKGMIPVEVQDNFFHRYSTFGKPDAKGLGTYKAKLIAQAHKGDITVNTSEEMGTELIVTLPVTLY